MTDTFKVLAQIAPSGTTLSTLYTVPGSTQTTMSTVAVCNRGAVDINFRLSVAVAGAADDPKQYISYDATVPANDSVFLTLGITLAPTDVLRCYAGNGNVSFSAFGVEVS